MLLEESNHVCLKAWAIEWFSGRYIRDAAAGT